MVIFRGLRRHDSITQVTQQIGGVVDPIKTHILYENQEFLHTL